MERLLIICCRNALKRRMQNAKEFGDELEKSQSFEEVSDVSEEKPVTPVLPNGEQNIYLSKSSSNVIVTIPVRTPDGKDFLKPANNLFR